MILASHVACMGGKDAYWVLVGKLKGKRLLVRPRWCWAVIKMDFREIGWNGFIWLRTGSSGGLL
jgi:hypothetical protein